MFLTHYICYNCFAQETSRQDSANFKKVITQHNLFLEIGGTGGLYNITYDCSFALSEKRKLAVGLGGLYIPQLLYFISPQINYLFKGKKNSHLELGSGYALVWFSGDLVPVQYVSIRIGYRYQRENGGFFWKITIVPTYEIGDLFLPMPIPGIAFGYTFKNNKQK